MVNVYSENSHILSPRLNDGGISLTLEGAKKLCDSRFPISFEENDMDSEFLGLPKVCINDDAIPFVAVGRNVMHGYILGADNHLIPGQPCLIVDSKGNLVAHGIPMTSSTEMKFFKKGIAVRVREGVLKNSS
jgi:predicted RNA-binding protein (TIGR00451 family)